MSTEHSSYTIDELALCKLIAHELSEGPHSVEEIYGMLILICRLRDAPASRYTDYSTLPIPPLGG